MTHTRVDYPVVIIGAGPVGLFLAIGLRAAGIDCLLLEQREQHIGHSRSIGIHPVALEAMAPYGLAEALIARGVRIGEGRAYVNQSYVGSIDFSHCPKPFNFILAVPQWITESVLEQHLLARAPGCLRRGAWVTAVEDRGDAVRVQWEDATGSQQRTAAWVVGCDGWYGVTRKAMGCRVLGGVYPDQYLMGDFADTTGQGARALIYLHRHGLVESFPLPEQQRRWVVKTRERIEDDQRAQLVSRVAQRTGYDLSALSPTMLSSFGVQHYLATPMARGRVLLAGDAAHVVSPIGGQGMNLGWLDAEHLITLFAQGTPASVNIFRRYERQRRSMARRATRRALFNMALGRRAGIPWWRRWLLHLLLRTPMRHHMARVFSMRGLASGIADRVL